MADLKRLVAMINKDTRKSVGNYIPVVTPEITLTEGKGVLIEDFERASELAGVLYEACIEAHLEDFEAVRRGLAYAYEGIVRPQGHSFQVAWKEILSVWVGKEGAIPHLEKAVARLLIKEARKARLEAEGSPSARIVVHKGDYIAVYKGGKWTVGMK